MATHLTHRPHAVRLHRTAAAPATPPATPPAPASPRSPIRRLRSAVVDRRRPWQRELALVAVLYLVYAASRLASFTPSGAAERNGHRVLDLERALHIDPEHALNDLLYSAPRWLSIAAAYFYETMHYLMTAVVLIWLYRSGSAVYRKARSWLVAMTFPALIVFWAFPVAPPRSVSGAVAHDTIAEQHSYGWWGSGGGTAPRGLAGLVNDNAAMPSLHVGWALWVGWNLVHTAKSPVVRAFGYVYPLITVTVVLSTGNHYLLDVLAGTLLAVLSKQFVDRVLPRLTRPANPPVAPASPPARPYTRVRATAVRGPAARPTTVRAAPVRPRRQRHRGTTRIRM